MTSEEFVNYIEKQIYPYKLLANGRAEISSLVEKYPDSLLMECVNIGIKQYFRYDDDGKLTTESVSQFISKLSGIAFNKSRNPIDSELYHIKNSCKKSYPYWNDAQGNAILARYVRALKNAGWSEENIVDDLKIEVKNLCFSCRNWTQWSDTMEQWIKDIENQTLEENNTIRESGIILPTPLFENTSYNIQSVCKQINASYENNLYDCTAVMMRRLLEGLLILAYQKFGIESEITEKNGWHFSLDRIIKNAIQNSVLSLTASTKRDMPLFKDIGNFSAHKIWYNSTKQDLEPHILKYRVIIEELMYKAGVK